MINKGHLAISSCGDPLLDPESDRLIRNRIIFARPKKTNFKGIQCDSEN